MIHLRLRSTESFRDELQGELLRRIADRNAHSRRSAANAAQVIPPAPEADDPFLGDPSSLIQRSNQRFLKGRPEKHFFSSFDIYR